MFSVFNFFSIILFPQKEFFFTLKVHDMHNMETLLIQWFSMAPWISLLMGFDCNQKL